VLTHDKTQAMVGPGTQFHLVSSEQPESLSQNSESIALQTALQGVMGGEDVAVRQTPCAKHHRSGPRTCVKARHLAETFGVGKKDPGGFRGEVSATAAHDAGERRGGLELEP
jgi:hypothetical protein